MSEETKSVCSSESPEADSSASEARPAAPPAVATVHALVQEVQLDIVQGRAKFCQAMAKYQDFLSTYNAALVAWNEDPNNEDLTKRLAEAKRSEDTYKFLMDSYARSLSELDDVLVRFQAALFEEKVRAGPMRLPQNHPTVKMWESVLKGEVKQDVTSYEHIITSVFPHGALPFGGYSAPKDAAGNFVLIERKSHTALYDRIAKRAEENTRNEGLGAGRRTYGYAVIGPPGTGNACSLNHVFLRCAAIKEVSEGSGKRKKPVIVCDRAVDKVDGRYLIFTPGPDPKVEICYGCPAVLKDRETIYLYESPKGSASPDRYANGYMQAFYVVATNPNRTNFDGVRKSAALLYAYRWEPEEAEEVQKALGLQANSKIVSECGFNLRLLTMGKSAASAKDELIEALDKVKDHASLDKLLSAISLWQGDLLTWSHRLFTMIPPEDDAEMFRDYIDWPVSEYVSDQIHLRLTPMQVILTPDQFTSSNVTEATK